MQKKMFYFEIKKTIWEEFFMNVVFLGGGGGFYKS